MSNKNIILECSNIEKVFKNQEKSNIVLKDLSFSVYENEFLVLFGPGQCGKTTILRVLSGIENIDSGIITVKSNTLNGLNNDVAMVYQDAALFPWMNVTENVSFGLRMQRVPAKTWKPKAQEMIDLVGLTGFEKHYPVKLSGGMCQRVGIARAYCNNKDIILMDEPFGHLDAQTRYQMEEEIEKIYQHEKKTIVFVTNNVEEAVYLADRIILLSDCPTSVAEEFTVDIPRPRNYTSPQFLKLRQEISNKANLRSKDN